MDAILDISIPALEKFSVISGPMHESSSANMNGKLTQSTGISFEIKPKATGTFIIGPARVRLRSGDILTNKVTVTVTNSTTSSSSQSSIHSLFGTDFFEEPQPQIAFSDMVLKKGEDITQKINRNMELRLQINKASCYVGEPVLAEYKLYSRLRSDSRLIRTPSFNGFSVIDIPDSNQSDFKIEKLNGKEYNVYSLRKAQLYPLQAGTFPLDPMEVENNIQFIKEEYLRQAKKQGNFWGGDPSLFLPADAYVNQKMVLRSTPVTILVKPLPDSNKPVDFAGAVGNYSITARLEKNNFGINETGKLTLTISGEGNLPLLTAPKISWPNGIESFDPQVKSNFSTTTVPISGNKDFVYYFSPNQQGKFLLPSVSFSYFNPKTGKYQSAKTNPIPFEVGKAVANPFTNPVFVKANRPTGINQIFYHRWWIIIGFALISLTGLLIWVIKTGNKQHNAVANHPAIEPEPFATPVSTEKDFLSGVQSSMNSDNSKDFYRLLLSAYKQFLSENFQLPTSVITPSNIKMALKEKGVPTDEIAPVEEILREIEACVYMPYEKGNQMDRLFLQTKNSIEKLTRH